MTDQFSSAADRVGPYDIRAKFDQRFGWWVLRMLVCPPNSDPKWMTMSESGGPYGRLLQFGQDREAAEAAATSKREQLGINANLEKLNQSGMTSLSLKISKAVVSRVRLDTEEAMMAAEARRRNADAIPVPENAIILHAGAEAYRTEIVQKTREMPYLRTMILGSGATRAILRSRDGISWGRPWIRPSARAAEVAGRAEISEGFGIAPEENWASTKGAIRRLLLPRANELLQLASVKRLLDEALAQGKRALVLGNFIFWYELDGQVGWVVKEVRASKPGEEGDTIWEAGRIVSKNHGRIVVLPYIKDSGEHVSGYTKNASGDGPALPRHHTQFVEIPFSRLEGDQMITLFGSLPYE